MPSMTLDGTLLRHDARCLSTDPARLVVVIPLGNFEFSGSRFFSTALLEVFSPRLYSSSLFRATLNPLTKTTRLSIAEDTLSAMNSGHTVTRFEDSPSPKSTATTLTH